jgi:hypothetical protein
MAYNGDWYAWAFSALTVAIVSAVYTLLFRRFDVESLALGALAWWCGLCALTAFAAPAASYLFLWPLIANLAGLIYVLVRPPAAREGFSALPWILPAAVGILLTGTLPYLLVMLLGTVLLAPLIVAVALLVGFLVPQIYILARWRRWLLPGAGAIAALGLVGAGMATAGYGPNRPRGDSIFYALDADNKSAFWGSADPGPDNWTSQFLHGSPGKGNLTELGIGPRPTIETPTLVLNLDTPSLTDVEDSVQGGRRHLAFDLHFAPGTALVWVSLKNAHVFSSAINGKPVSGGGDKGAALLGASKAAQQAREWVLIYAAPPQEGLRVQLEMDSGDSPSIQVAQDSSGLPSIPELVVWPRPTGIMPTQWWPPLDSSTVVTRTFERFDGTIEK